MISKKMVKKFLPLVMACVVTFSLASIVSVHASALFSMNKLAATAVKTIVSIDDASRSVTVYKNAKYTLPTKATATLSDGSTKSVAVKWSPTKAITSQAGTTTYTGTVTGYTGEVNLTLTLIVREITSIDDIEDTVNQSESYVLPTTLSATLDDGSTESVAVKWSPTKATTTKDGIFPFTGTVVGYAKKPTLTLTVNPTILITAEPVDLNETYTYPKKVTVSLINGTKVTTGVTWDTPTVDTSKAGTYTLMGTLIGYDGRVKVTLKVLEGLNIKKVTFIKLVKPTYARTYTFASVLTLVEAANPAITGITLSVASTKTIRLDLENVAGTTYNAIYIDKNNDKNYDSGTDQIVGQFTIITKGTFANTYEKVTDGIKVVAGDKGTVTFTVYDAEGTKVKASTPVTISFK